MPGINSAHHRRTSSSTPTRRWRSGSPPQATSSSISTSRWRGRSPSSPSCRRGSHRWIGLTVRPRNEFPTLFVNKRFEDVADHLHVIAAAFELPLQVDEIGGGGIQALGQ